MFNLTTFIDTTETVVMTMEVVEALIDRNVISQHFSLEYAE